MDADADVTQMLADWRNGDAKALHRLIPRVYADLRAMASRRLAEHQGHDTLQPTALVHDLLLRLMGSDARDIADRHHFFNYAGRMMRQLLVDRARRASSGKHGGGLLRDDLDVSLIPSLPADLNVQALDEALDDLEALDPRMARLVELRWFVGLSVNEAARALETDETTLYRDWTMARAWLRERISSS